MGVSGCLEGWGWGGTRLVESCLILPFGGRCSGGHVRADHPAAEQGRLAGALRRVGAQPPRGRGDWDGKVLVHLGREDVLDRDGLARLVVSVNRYLGVPAPAGVPADAVELVGDSLTVTQSRPVGAVHLLDGLWRQLGVDVALRTVLGPRRFTTDVERVLFALVANRAVDPASKLAAAGWATHGVAIDGLAAMDEDQARRAMDLRRGRRPSRGA